MEQQPPPVKRGRGRPRKNPLPQQPTVPTQLVGSCPSLPSKIEVVVDKKEETATDAQLKKLRAKLKKSQLRLREIEAVLASSLIHIVHNNRSEPEGRRIDDTSIKQEEKTERAERLVAAKRNLSTAKDLSASERLKRELEQSLDTIAKSLEREQTQLNALQKRYQRISTSIRRELWRVSLTNDTVRGNELKQLLSDQTIKFNTLSENANTRIQILTSRNQTTLTQYKQTLEDIRDAKEKQEAYNMAFNQLV
jgi:hypothetical protein